MNPNPSGRCASRSFALGLLLALFGFTGFLPSRAADNPPSEHAFNVARQLFRDGLWDRADRELGAFVTSFPESAHVAEAVLLQAQSRFQLKRYEPAIALLAGRLKLAGPLSDQYRYWMAEAQFERGNFAAAAEAYAELLKHSLDSPLRLKASYGEAFARFKLDDFPKTIELLQKPDGPFQQEARKAPRDEVAIRGQMLLGEVLYQQKNYPVATDVLNQLTDRISAPEVEWQRQYLLAMVDLAAQRPDAALGRTTNLLAIGTGAGKPRLQASSLKLQAEILEQKQPETALQTYDRIAGITNLPLDQVRQAVLKSVDLAVALNRLTDAIQRLEGYLAATNSAADPALDLLRCTLGELHLKRYYQVARARTNTVGGAVETNALGQARRQFDLLINTQTNSPLLGKAFLNRGWCLWEESQTPGGDARLPECLAAFQIATEKLTNSEDQAVARFKWADCQFLQRNFTNAIQNYRTLLSSYDKVSTVRARWFDQALYQIIRASVEIRDLAGGRAALDRMLAEFRGSPMADQSMILFGRALLDAREPARAREIFTDFQKLFPQSPLQAEAELGMAASYRQEADWASAQKQYDQWVSRHTNHPALPQTEFDRALAHFKGGNETNAFVLFTNLVARFPESRLAPLAQFWVGDYFFSQGRFDLAEYNYKNKILVQNTNAPSPQLAYQAWLMAARAAYFRQGYSQARGYLTNLISQADADTNAPPGLVPEAFFLLGQIDLNEPVAPEGNPLDRFDLAISKFRRVREGLLEPRARCQIGYCYLQLASTNAQHYDQATREFSQVIDSAVADVATRSEAEFLLASVLEKQAQETGKAAEEQKKMLTQSLDHYLNIIYAKRVRSDRNEQPDLAWVNRAGLSAGALAERLQRFGDARRIYERLRVTLPALRERWEKKIEALPPPTSG